MRGYYPPYDIEIYVKNADGTGYAQITDTEGYNYRPSWQPLNILPTGSEASVNSSDQERPDED